jgi:hypothetical protein
MVYYSSGLVLHFDCEMMLEFNFAMGGHISYYLYKFQRLGSLQTPKFFNGY